MTKILSSISSMKMILSLMTILLLMMLLSCSDREVIHKRHFFRMNTIVDITISADKSFDIAPLWKSVDSLLRYSEERFSATGERSEVRVLNDRSHEHDAVAALPVSFELCEMLQAGLAYGDSLDGAFDITVLPLKKLWGFCEECDDDMPLPNQEQIDEAIRRVDYRNITINKNCDTVFFASAYTRVDVGGIAKGFILRRLSALIEKYGAHNYIISAGGDIIALGGKEARGAGRSAWVIGVRDPRDPSSLAMTIPVTSGAIVTSGDYERYRIVDGVRYHHIFNPKTGRSCDINQSVTIIADDPVVADILSTALFCRGAREIFDYVNLRENLDAVVVDGVGVVHAAKP